MPINLSTLVDQTNSLQLAKAWVNFNGTTASPSTIRSSYNVSSITKNGTGDYTVNFATALADANYSVIGTSVAFSATTYLSVCLVGTQAAGATLKSTTQVRVNSLTTALYDSADMSVQIFGN
jgi:hypothetical protein